MEIDGRAAALAAPAQYIDRWARQVDEAKDYIQIGQVFESVERERVRNIDLFQVHMQVAAFRDEPMRQLAGVAVQGPKPTDPQVR